MIKKIIRMKSKKFYICKKKFNTDDDNKIVLNKKYQKVIDHCHYTRKFRGADYDFVI